MTNHISLMSSHKLTLRHIGNKAAIVLLLIDLRGYMTDVLYLPIVADVAELGEPCKIRMFIIT